MTPAVALIPRRSDNGGPRDQAWRWVEDWWFSTHIPFSVGEHLDGPFNRSAAINDAAHHAPPWEVAVIADADVWIPRDQLRKAVETARKSHRLVIGFDARHALTESATSRILRGGHNQIPEPDDIEATQYGSCSAMICVSRKLWERVGGFDEGFAGWGHEDTAFRQACTVLSGRQLRIDGPLWHLWHPPAPETDPDHPLLAANKARFERYEHADTTRAMRRLLAELSSD